MIRDVVISLSLANLCMISMWHNLLYRAPSSSSNDYFLKSSPYPLTLGAAFLDLLLLAAAILPFIILAGRRRTIGTVLARLVVLAMLFFRGILYPFTWPIAFCRLSPSLLMRQGSVL